MSYRLDLNCADRVRFAEVASKLGMDGESLAKLLIHSFFERTGVKNPSKRAVMQRKNCRTHRA